MNNIIKHIKSQKKHKKLFFCKINYFFFITFFFGLRIISSKKVSARISKIVIIMFATSSGRIAWELSSPGIKSKVSKKGVRTIPGKRVEIRIELCEHSSLKLCANPLKANFEAQ